MDSIIYALYYIEQEFAFHGATQGQRAQIFGILRVDKIGGALFVFALGAYLRLKAAEICVCYTAKMAAFRLAFKNGLLSARICFGNILPILKKFPIK